METMPPRERFLAALRCEEPDRVPVFDWITNRSLYSHQIGMKPRDFDPVLATRLNKSLGLDAVWVPVGGNPGLMGNYSKNHWLDGHTFIDEWGITNRAGEESWPLGFAIEHPIKSEYDWQGIQLPDPVEDWRAQYARDALAEARREPGQELAVVAGIRGPFSMAFLLMGLTPMSFALFENADLLEGIFSATAEFWTAAGLRLIEQGLVDGLVIHEDMGSNTSTFFSPEHMQKRVLPYLRQEISTLASTGTPIILHSCGNINGILPDLMDMALAGLNNLQQAAKMDIAAVKAAYGHKICLIGNVDASNLLPYASQIEIEQAVVDCLRLAAPGGGHVLASDHSLHDGIPVESIHAFIDAGQKYGSYPLALPALAD